MGQPCLTCHCPKRDQIDIELAGGESATAIAKRYGLGADSVRRHRRSHLSPALHKLALERRSTESAVAAYDSTVDRIEGLMVRLENLMFVAVKRKSLVGGANVARELRQCLELLAKLRGELSDKPVVAVNILASPELGRLIGVLLKALDPFPEARIAAAEALDAEEVIDT